MSQIASAIPERLLDTVTSLAGGIGERLAGSAADDRTIAAVHDAFAAIGIRVWTETFPVLERAVEEEHLEVRIGDEWQVYPCSLFSSVPGTNGETLTAPVVAFDSATEYDRPDLSHLSGKAVLHLGCHIESREAYRRLMEAAPAFLLFVDTRYPGGVPPADGMFPSYTRALGAVPTLSVAYLHAWEWCRRGATTARIRVSGGMQEGSSANVVAEIPGLRPDGPILFFGGHHDTQADSPGADDNATGVAAVLELARLLLPVAHGCALRFISFGAEEQLSVGSAAYVRAHREELATRGGLMLNFDSFGSWMGTTELICAGSPVLAERLLAAFRACGVWPNVTTEAVPYTDQFPFAAAGVPGVSVCRHNCVAGRFFHHRPDDDETRISPGVMAQHVDAVARFVCELSDAEALPFALDVPAEQASPIAAFWEDLYGG